MSGKRVITGQIEQDIQTNRADIGLTYEPVPVKGVEFLKICRIRMAVFGRASTVRDLEFSQWPFAAPRLPSEFSPTGVKGLDGWLDDKHPRKIRYDVDMMETALGLARQGKAVVHLPIFVASLHNRVIQKSFHLEALKVTHTPVQRWAYLVQRSGESESKLTKKLTQFLRQVSQV